MQRKIIEYVANGNYYEVACRAAGVTKQAVDYWRKLVEQKVEHAQKYADFFDALARASALAEANAVARISQGGRDWQGPAWFVERRFRKRWGKVEAEPAVKSDLIEEANERRRKRKADRPAD